VDDDLIMDAAKKLSAQGVSTHIIPPYSKKKLYRLAVGNFDTKADAEASISDATSKYGTEIWVIKY
jgi:cell division protein FtsN